MDMYERFLHGLYLRPTFYNLIEMLVYVMKSKFHVKVAAFTFGKSIYVAFPESHRLHTYSKVGVQLPLDGSKSCCLVSPKQLHFRSDNETSVGPSCDLSRQWLCVRVAYVHIGWVVAAEGSSDAGPGSLIKTDHNKKGCVSSLPVASSRAAQINVKNPDLKINQSTGGTRLRDDDKGEENMVWGVEVSHPHTPKATHDTAVFSLSLSLPLTFWNKGFPCKLSLGRQHPRARNPRPHTTTRDVARDPSLSPQLTAEETRLPLLSEDIIE
ncbi:hypothetical protein C0J52_27525 [Blattella germanica]|nr:hypothetical protein C0J52_27525 [Blattella germanica]